MWPKSLPRVSTPSSVPRSLTLSTLRSPEGSQDVPPSGPPLGRDASCRTPSGASGRPGRRVDGTSRSPFRLLSSRDSPGVGSLRFGVLLLRAGKAGSATPAPAALRASAGGPGREPNAVRWSSRAFAPPGVCASPESSCVCVCLFPPLCLQGSAFCTKSRCYSCFLQGAWSGSMVLGHYKRQKSWALFLHYHG